MSKFTAFDRFPRRRTYNPNPEKHQSDDSSDGTFKYTVLPLVKCLFLKCYLNLLEEKKQQGLKRRYSYVMGRNRSVDVEAIHQLASRER